MKMWHSEQLWLKAKILIDRANGTDQSSRDFPFWSALSLELLARAALTRFHPVLNADPRKDTSILYACGFEIASQPRSLPAHAVYIRLQKTISEFGKTQRELCDFLGLLRNQDLHTAELPFDKLKESEWLPRFYEVCKILCESMGKALEDFVGNDVGASARKLILSMVEGIEGTVGKQIAECKKAFEAMSPSEQARLRAEVNATLRLLPEGVVLANCPACGSGGKLEGELIRELPPTYDDGLTCLGIVDTPRSSIFYRYRRCVYEWSRNFTSEKAV